MFAVADEPLNVSVPFLPFLGVFPQRILGCLHLIDGHSGSQTSMSAVCHLSVVLEGLSCHSHLSFCSSSVSSML